MKFRRRQILHLAAGTAALPVTSRFAWSENYPARPVHLIVGFFAAGLTDILSRILAEWLAERFGQQFIVENVAGAGTNIATERVVRASPDGYTLLMATSSNAINATLYEHLNFDFLRDTAPVASVARTPLVMTVNRRFRPRRSLSSSPTRKLVLARSTWQLPAREARSILPASFSWP